MSPANHFPADYRKARARVSSKPRRRQALASPRRLHPAAKGADGKKLFLDTATIGPRDAKKALLLISGHPWRGGLFRLGRADGAAARGACRGACRRRQDRDRACAQSVRLFVEPARQRGQCRHQPQFRRSHESAGERGLRRSADAIAPKDISPESVKRGEREAARLSRCAWRVQAAGSDQRGPIQTCRRALFRRQARKLVGEDAEGCVPRGTGAASSA